MSTRTHKCKGITETDRRRIALDAQRVEDRSNQLAALRQLFDDGPEGEYYLNRHYQSSQQFANELQFPDWMIEAPADLGSNWLVQLRPEGKRVILIIKEGRVSIRSKQGKLLTRNLFVEPGLLPFGLTILDCIIPDTIQGMANCIYVMDVIYWDQGGLGDSEAEFRHYWLKSRFSEIHFQPNLTAGFGSGVIDWNSIETLPRLLYVPPLEANSESISRLYQSGIEGYQFQDDALEWEATAGSYIADSLLFINKASIYTPGLTPLVLQWRDRSLSRFAIDTDDFEGLGIPEKQSVVLAVRRSPSDDGRIQLITWDSVFVCEGVESDIVSINDTKQKFQPRTDKADDIVYLVRAKIRGIDEQGNLLGLSDVKKVSPGRVFPDSYARIKTQAALRQSGHGLVTIDQMS